MLILENPLEVYPITCLTLIIILFLCKYCICMGEYVSIVSVWVCEYVKHQKMESDPLKMELQVLVNHQKWGWNPNSGFLKEQKALLTTEVSL